ncbi:MULTISPECIES: cytochrome P450 [unclassified Nocardiopsis]|uniref:cytochrome P450 n=1 Tax=unclassified Nocardiopsis TaxID=2649073 RepID=UPI001357410B|nr:MULTISPECIES: cytochrome P450 [unclassified Nocardiopsis]
MADSPTRTAGTPTRPACPVSLPTAREHALDPPRRFAELREESPITRLALPDGTEGWLVTDYELACDVLADQRFSARQDLRVPPGGQEPPPPAAPGFFVRMDAPEHTRYRRHLAGQFTRRRMALLEPRVAEIAEEYAERMAAGGAPADLVRDYALPVPSLVVCELLGVPYAERDRFQRDTAVAFDVEQPAERVTAALSDLSAFLADLVRSRSRSPREDLVSGLLGTGDLTEEEVTAMTFLLLVAGHETTASMLSLGVFALLTGPAGWRGALTGPDRRRSERVVDELLRHLTIMQFGAMRVAREDLEVRGERVRAGEAVVVSLAAANRDPRAFPEPDALDPDRERPMHLAFGVGAHHCLGHQLARMELRIGYGALFRRLPDLRLAVAPRNVRMRDASAVYGVQSLPVAWGA